MELRCKLSDLIDICDGDHVRVGVKQEVHNLAGSCGLMGLSELNSRLIGIEQDLEGQGSLVQCLSQLTTLVPLIDGLFDLLEHQREPN